MSFAELADRYDDFYVPAFEVRVGDPDQDFEGADVFTGDRGLVSGLRIDTAIDRLHRFSFSLGDCFDRTAGTDGQFDPGLQQTFAVGTDVELRTGYGTEASETLLRGRIDAVEPNFPAEGAPSLSVDGFDLRDALQRGTGTGRWEQTDLTTVVRDLTADPPFRGREIDPGSVTITDLHHPETSDHELLERLAGEHDCEFFTRGGTAHFRRQAAVEDLSPEATLRYGRALRSFTPGSAKPRAGEGEGRADRSQVGTVKVRHNDETSREPIVGTADVPGGGSETRVETIPVRSQTEAEERAASIAGEIARTGDDRAGSTDGPPAGGHSGSRAETLGLPEVQVGRVLELTGLGVAFSGRYHVETATHRVDDSGYATSFGLRRLPDE